MLRKLVGYAAYMFGANTATALLTFGVSALGMATRPKEAFGDYALYTLVYSVINGLFIAGGNATIQRYAAADDTTRFGFAKLIYLLLPLNLVLFGALAALFHTYAGTTLEFQLFGFHPKWSWGESLSLSFLAVPWVVMYWYARYLLRSKLDAKREARLMVVASLTNSVLQFCLLRFTDLRDALIYGDFIAQVTSGVFALLLLPRGLGTSLSGLFRARIPRHLLAEALQTARPMWLAGQVHTLKVRLADYWTAFTIGQKELAALAAMQQMWQFAGKPIEFLGHAALPGLVAAKEDREILYRDLLRFCLIALPVVGISVAGGIPLVFQILDLLYVRGGGEGLPLQIKYAEVPLLIMVQSLAVPFTAVELVTNQYSIVVNRPRTVFYAQVVTVLAMVALLLPMGEKFGLVGVVLTAVIGEVCNSATFIIALYKQHRDSMRSAFVWGSSATAATIIALVPIWLTRGHSLGWLVTIPALGLFLLVMLLLGVIKPHDFQRMLKAALRR